MSFPATYNLRYYKGDLSQFVIRPKTSAGAIYPIDSSTYYAYFRISTSRGGASGDTLLGSTSVSDNAVTCELRPSIGNSLVIGTTYYYDVSIEDKTDSNILYTLLTGTITITGDITTP
tara:strand:- start:1524 stop:1877 length:354 start_codon:yes stop_codon:yes gene_type:complete